jgi:cullin-4
MNVYIKEKGKELIGNPSQDEVMIDSILVFKSKIETILNICFEKDAEFSYSQKEAFESFISEREDTPPTLLAKFIHNKLIAGKKKFASDGELEESLDNVIQIFRYCSNKDVFEGFYKQDLAKRLLLNKSISLDSERSMIQRLRTECGSQFTSKLEGMFKDIALSEEIMSNFQNSTYINTSRFMDLKVQILTTGYWPLYNNITITLPQEMALTLENFDKFYNQNFNGRKLNWQHSLSSLNLKANYPKAYKEFQVSVDQGVVLLLFNENEELTYQNILDNSGINSEELPRIMHSLASGKVRILQKEPNHSKILNTDIFGWRKNFTSKSKRVRFNQFQLMESNIEKESIKKTIAMDRVHQIDAAIVRIMKTRKRLTHSQLMAEVFSQLKFKIETSVLKKRIDVLIQRDYMGRDDQDTNTFFYKA